MQEGKAFTLVLEVLLSVLRVVIIKEEQYSNNLTQNSFAKWLPSNATDAQTNKQ